MAQPELVKDIEARVKKSGDTMTGNLKVPNLDVAISFVSPTLYLSVFPVFTALAIVAHESLAKDIGSEGLSEVS